MKYIIRNMNDDIAKQISLWKYEGEYEIYNTLSFEDMKKSNSGLVDPEKKNNYLCFFEKETSKLIGYVNIMKKENEDVFMGIGLSPNCCGQGLGTEILEIAIKESMFRYPKSKITLQVRSWNQRAIKCYIKAGFEIEKTETILDYTGKEAEFVFMKYGKNYK